MGSGTSPNDPVFYLNHGNEDRLWEAWTARHGREHRPAAADAGAPLGHRLDDTMVTLLREALRPVGCAGPGRREGHQGQAARSSPPKVLGV